MSRPLKKRRLRDHFMVKVAVVAFIAVCLVLIFGLSGCASFDRSPSPAPKTIESSQPIPVMPQAPEIIIRKWQPAMIPEWVAPDHPDASSCLKAEGEDSQRRNMQEEQRIRQRARQWANGGLL